MNARTESADGGMGELRDAIAGLTERLQAVEASVGADGPGLEDDERSIIAVTKLKGLCVHGGRIFTHETGYCGKGTLSTDRSVLYVPTPAVEANRELPAEDIECLFTPLGNRQRVILLRALSRETPPLFPRARACDDGTLHTHGLWYLFIIGIRYSRILIPIDIPPSLGLSLTQLSLGDRWAWTRAPRAASFPSRRGSLSRARSACGGPPTTEATMTGDARDLASLAGARAT